MSNHKNKDHKGPKGSSPAVKVGEVVQEKAPRDKEKAEGPASAGKEKTEQTPLGKVHAELEVRAKDTAEWQDNLLRLGAEFENYKTRMQKEKSNLMKSGNESLLKALLPILCFGGRFGFGGR